MSGGTVATNDADDVLGHVLLGQEPAFAAFEPLVPADITIQKLWRWQPKNDTLRIAGESGSGESDFPNERDSDPKGAVGDEEFQTRRNRSLSPSQSSSFREEALAKAERTVEDGKRQRAAVVERNARARVEDGAEVEQRARKLRKESRLFNKSTIGGNSFDDRRRSEKGSQRRRLLPSASRSSSKTLKDVEEDIPPKTAIIEETPGNFGNLEPQVLDDSSSRTRDDQDSHRYHEEQIAQIRQGIDDMRSLETHQARLLKDVEHKIVLLQANTSQTEKPISSPAQPSLQHEITELEIPALPRHRNILLETGDAQDEYVNKKRKEEVNTPDNSPRNSQSRLADFMTGTIGFIIPIVSQISEYVTKEPPLQDGQTRIRWTCQCGSLLWDDFSELRPGAVEALRRSLHFPDIMGDFNDASTRRRHSKAAEKRITHLLDDDSETSSLSDAPPQIPGYISDDDSETSSISGPPPQIPGHFPEDMDDALSGSEVPGQRSGHANIGLPTTGDPSGNPPSGHAAGEQDIVPGQEHRTTSSGWSFDSIYTEKKYLLLCISRKHDTLRLLQLNVENIGNDFQLFKMLRDVYTSRLNPVSRYISLRKLGSVKFRKAGGPIERHPRERVVILAGQDILPQRSNPKVCHKDHAYPKCDTAYNIDPSPPDLDPYVGRNGLEHLLTHPHEAEEDGNLPPAQKVWLRRFPKKEKTKLTTCPPYQYGLGWAVELEEEWNMSWLMKAITIFLMLAATTFLVCWWRYKGDVQGASGMAGLLVSCGTLLMAYFSAVSLV
ncbi:uncharacterized protein KY384_008878 [Bacidia gigantensis]|uniref:uncharacterized protein n=1 Tax=Bacidia gigantensis TaxID=2732470 RepID=UPI001D03EA23|nr:uncharacterized protein KY384_008878 [Bacidia gigantensis]KAG8525234.1 hypothetical protein KY384_008878 [Bacidia gigantensis]